MGKLTHKVALLSLTILFFFSTSVAPALAAITYLYDANGNLTSDGSKCYEYNQENQLVKVKTCGNSQTIAEYVYDYQGQRLVKKEYSNGTLQKTTFSPGDSYETVKLVSGTTQNTSYYFANDELIAKKNPDGSKNYFLTDHLGSDSVQTNQTGTSVESTQYDPWGEVLAGGTKNKFQYTGQEKDSETGLNYYNARYYDPHTRHFTQADGLVQDIYDPQLLNRYAYVRNNPIKYSDPSGNFVFLAVPLTMWVVAAFLGGSAVYTATPQGQKTVQSALRSAYQGANSLVSQSRNAVSNVSKAIANSTKTGSQSTNPSNSSPKNNSPYGKSPNLGPIQKIAPLAPAAEQAIEKIHGNDLRNSLNTIGYTLRDTGSGVIQKFGITSNQASRYSQTYLNSNKLELVQEVEGSRHDVYVWEHEQIGEYLMKNLELPSLNKSLH